MPPKREDLIGLRFGRLDVLKYHGLSGNNKTLWVVKCDCGKEKIVRSDHMKSGRTKSCGCLSREMASDRNQTHGMTQSPIYKTWAGMKDRCLNKKNTHYKDYGGRGIKMCEEWESSFEKFYRDMGGRPEGLTLERIDNDKGYYKENCKWATRKEQANNTRRNRILTHNGISLTMSQWEDELNINKGALKVRLRRGVSLSKALQ